MKLKNLSASALSREAGVSKQVISLWLGGAEPRKITQLKKVADTLGVSIETLCFGVTPKSSAQGVVDLINGDWMQGKFEIKIRKIKE